ncbi:MAG: ParM/StbA family protein [Rivularia sp. (in: cyanobacteria)]
MKKNTAKINNFDDAPFIVISLDFGGSGTKGIYSLYQNTEAHSLFMEPEVIKVTLESIKNYEQNLMGTTHPENRAWVSVKNETKAVGYLARNKYYANSGLVELKYERAVHKTLAAIWVIKEKLKLPSKLRIALCVLFPSGEFENKTSFEQLIRGCCADYLTPSGTMQVECVMFNCLPEGAGIYLSHQKKVGDALKQKVCAVAMIGFRNASLLISHRGVVSREGKTSDLGMIRMVEKVVAATAGQTVERLTSAIAICGSEIDTRPLQKLLRSTTQEGRNNEFTQLTGAIKFSRHEYFTALTSWFNQVIPADVEEILFCGGTADYLKKELNSYYRSTPCIFNSISIPCSIDKNSLGCRLADVYGAFLYFDEMVKQRIVISSEVNNRV